MGRNSYELPSSGNYTTTSNMNASSHLDVKRLRCVATQAFRREQTGENDVAVQPLRRDAEWAALPSCSPVRCGLPVAAQSVSQPDEVGFERFARETPRLWLCCRSKYSEPKSFGDSKGCSSHRSPALPRKSEESGPSSWSESGQVESAIVSLLQELFRSLNRT